MWFTLSFHLNTKADSKKLIEFLTCWSRETVTSLTILPLRKRTKLLTLVKSPHVFKKSKEQFSISVFVVRVRLIISNVKSFYKMLTYLVNTVDLLCVKVKVDSNF